MRFSLLADPEKEKEKTMTLSEKLQKLRLPTMSQRLDQALQHAAEKNLSPAAALDWLADLELEARNGRAVERRFLLLSLAWAALHRLVPVPTP